MLVCPQCRHANSEDTQVCGSCGRSLVPEQVFLSSRGQSGGAAIEIAPPKPPPRWIPWAVVGVVGIAILGAMLVRRAFDPCRDSNFTSEHFGYCLTYPEGWAATAARIGEAQVDQFQLPNETAAVFVEAIDLASDTDLLGFAEIVRQRDQDAGLTPGPVSATSLDRQDARQ